MNGFLAPKYECSRLTGKDIDAKNRISVVIIEGRSTKRHSRKTLCFPFCQEMKKLLNRFITQPLVGSDGEVRRVPE
jgi:hypothetical protein